jgi:2',3'-cyclic-nucleotide 2'-phosphodiesterase (5'-nucleotidase family)
MKPDAVMVGTKDFAMGLETLQKWLKAIGAPVLAGNLQDPKTGKPLFQDTMILERGDRKIGLFGVVTADWANVSSGQAEIGIQVEDPIEYSKRAFAKLQGKADLIFALSSLNDGEVQKLTEAIPELKYILRSNAGIRNERKNKVIGNAIAMGCPSRGKYLALLSFVEKNGSLDFLDISERKAVESRVELYQSKIEQMMKREEVKDVDALKAKLAEDSPKRRRLDRYLQYMDQNREKLNQYPENQSYFEVERVSLDKRVGNDPEVLAEVEKVKAKWGDPGKMKRSIKPKPKTLNLKK